MEGHAIIKIYGSNTDCTINGKSKKYPTKAEVLALEDIEYLELEVRGEYDTYNTNIESKEYWNGGKLVKVFGYLGYSPKSIPIQYPAEGTTISIESIYRQDVVQKKFHWVDLGESRVLPNAIIDNPNLLMSVNIMGITNTHNDDGYRDIAFELEERGDA